MDTLWAVVLLAAVAASSNCEASRPRRQSLSESTPEKRIVCYHLSWSLYNSGDESFSPDMINPYLCTHIIYAYAKIERGKTGLVSFDPQADLSQGGFKKVIALKQINPDLKVILSAGGGREGTALFSQIAGNDEMRQQFITGALNFVNTNEFDGLDISWQWPGLGSGHSASDRDNYVLLARDLRDAMNEESEKTGKPDLILSVVAPKFQEEIIRGFNFDELSKYVDFFTIQTYDYHKSSGAIVNHLAPIYPIDTMTLPEFTVDNTINYYRRLGVDFQKLNLAIPLHGVSFFLVDPQQTKIGSPAEEPGEGREPGILWYNQICRRAVSENWNVVNLNKTAIGPYAFKNELWVAYEDEESVMELARYAGERALGGITFWALSFDDFRGNCHGKSFPLVLAGREAFLNAYEVVTQMTPYINVLSTTEPMTSSEVLTAVSQTPRPSRPRSRSPTIRTPRPVQPRQPRPPKRQDREESIGDNSSGSDFEGLSLPTAEVVLSTTIPASIITGSTTNTEETSESTSFELHLNKKGHRQG